MTAAGTVPAGKSVRDGVGVAACRRCDRAPAGRRRHRGTDVRPATKDRQVESSAPNSSRSRRGVQERPEPPAATPRNVEKYQAKQAALTGRARQETGHRHHDGPDPAARRQNSSAPRWSMSMKAGLPVLVDLAVERAAMSEGGSRRSRRYGWDQDRATPTSPAASRLGLRPLTRATCSHSSRR